MVAWQFLVKPVLRNVRGFDEVEWRGEKFKLKQKYLDYEEYKSDSDQLAPGEVERVKQFHGSYPCSEVRQFRQGVDSLNFQK